MRIRMPLLLMCPRKPRHWCAPNTSAIDVRLTTPIIDAYTTTSASDTHTFQDVVTHSWEDVLDIEGYAPCCSSSQCTLKSAIRFMF